MRTQLSEIWRDVCAWCKSYPAVTVVAGAALLIGIIAMFRGMGL